MASFLSVYTNRRGGACTNILEGEDMEKPHGVTKEQRKKLQKVAMHKLVPRCVRYCTEIPLTVAGKIRLSRYPNQALEHALSRYNKSLAPNLAFKDIVSLAEGYCRENYRSFNDEAVSFLSDLYRIKPSDASVLVVQNRPELIPWMPKENNKEAEPVYVSYFKLKEHFSHNNYSFPNPYQRRFEEYVEEALSSFDGITKEEIERELYKLYLKQKGEDGIHDTRSSDCTQKTSIYENKGRTCI